MRTDKTNVNIIKEIAEHFVDLDADDIYAIVDSQFKTVAEEMANKRFVSLPLFGRFSVKEGRDKYIAPEKRFYEPHMGTSLASTDDDEPN